MAEVDDVVQEEGPGPELRVVEQGLDGGQVAGPHVLGGIQSEARHPQLQQPIQERRLLLPDGSLTL